MFVRLALLASVLLILPGVASADCESDSDCKNGRFCVGGLCRDWAGQCFKDVDCEGSLVCEGGRCADGAAAKTTTAVEAKGGYVAERGSFGERGAAGAGYSLSREFEGAGFYMSYGMEQTSGKDEHEFNFPDLGFYIRMDRDAELKIRGQETLNRGLGGLWRIGAGVNQVQVWFDGSRLQMDINGERIGPIQAARSPGPQVGTWEGKVRGSRSRVVDLGVKPWDGSLK